MKVNDVCNLEARDHMQQAVHASGTLTVMLLLKGSLTSCCAACDRDSGVLRQKPSSLRCVVSGMAL